MAALPSARGLLPLVALLSVWQLLQTGNSPYFPPPSDWWNGLVLLAKSGRLYPALSATTLTLLLGLAVAVTMGAGVGLLMGVSPRLNRAVGPLLEFLRAIPPPAIVPVAILFMGYDERMKLTVVVLAAIWPIILNTSSAAERISSAAARRRPFVSAVRGRSDEADRPAVGCPCDIAGYSRRAAGYDCRDTSRRDTDLDRRSVHS